MAFLLRLQEADLAEVGLRRAFARMMFAETATSLRGGISFLAIRRNAGDFLRFVHVLA
jgi:hypothetical protein